ncbi:MAG: addiction module protein [Pseudomonadota bacterium]
MTTAEIFDSACKLRADERLKLIDALLESLDPAAWLVEASDRVAAMEHGELIAAPIDELFAKLRA